MIGVKTKSPHIILIRQVAAPHLSFSCSTAIIYYLLYVYTANRSFTQSQFAMKFRKFCVLYKSFFRKSAPLNTIINQSKLDHV